MGQDHIETRWQRFGHDRVYIKTAEGTDLGYLDLKTRQISPTTPESTQVLEECLTRWIQELNGSSGAASERAKSNRASQVDSGGIDNDLYHLPYITDDPLVSHDEELSGPTSASETHASKNEVRDLAQNRPGALARQEQQRLFKKAPIRNSIARIFDLHTDERSWRIGAFGEEVVASKLSRLKNSWHTLHAVEVGKNGSDIDHLVIGPGGVFTLNTKYHPRGKIWIAKNALMVNGQRTNYLRNSRFEAKRASQILSNTVAFEVPVFPVIVFVAVAGIKVKEAPEGVRVMGERYLVRWFEQRATVLSAEQVSRIYEVARMSTTWT